MNRSTGSVLTIAAALLAALWWSSLPGSAAPQSGAVTPARLLQVLPEQALAAAELRDAGGLAISIARYPELASAVAEWIDPSCVEAFFPPRLERPALMAVFPGEAGAPPLAALILPAGGVAALESAGCLPRVPGETLVSFSERGADWVTIERSAGTLRELVRAGAPGTFIDRARVLDGLERLAGSASVRGWVNPEALRSWLRQRARALEGTPAGALASLLLVESGQIELLTGQRTLLADGFTGALRASWRQQGLPPELLAPFVSGDLVARDLPPLAEELLLAARFPAGGETIVPWLSHAAAIEPRGPLRNVPFHLDELRERCGLDLAEELPRALGRQAALFVFRGDGLPAPAFAVETGDAATARALIRELLDYLRDHQRARSLGLASPSVWSRSLEDGELFGFELGPARLLLQVDDRLILVAGDQVTLRRARSFATREGLAGVRAPGGGRDQTCALRLRPAALLESLREGGLPTGDSPALDFLRSVESASLRGAMTRNDDAGTIDLRASGDMRYRR